MGPRRWAIPLGLVFPLVVIHLSSSASAATLLAASPAPDPPSAPARVADINPGPGRSWPFELVTLGESLYFSATDGSTGRELWMSDGTAAGTVMVADIRPGLAGSSLGWLTNVEGVLYFGADDGSSGRELWRSDGTAAGTTMVRDIGVVAPFYTSSQPSDLTDVGSTLYFQADNGVNGRELWKSDGTEAGTVMVKDINPGPAWPDIDDLTDVDGTLFFSASDGSNGVELWISDGTAAGTVMVKDIRPGPGNDIWDRFTNSFTNVDGTLYFVANDGSSGRELWRSDGTAAGTVMVKDIKPGPKGSAPGPGTSVGGLLYFRANDGSTGYELWRTNGTTAGTKRVADINPGRPSSTPYSKTILGGFMYFSAKDGSTGRELWRLQLG